MLQSESDKTSKFSTMCLLVSFTTQSKSFPHAFISDAAHFENIIFISIKLSVKLYLFNKFDLQLTRGLPGSSEHIHTEQCDMFQCFSKKNWRD